MSVFLSNFKLAGIALYFFIKHSTIVNYRPATAIPSVSIFFLVNHGKAVPVFIW